MGYLLKYFSPSGVCAPASQQHDHYTRHYFLSLSALSWGVEDLEDVEVVVQLDVEVVAQLEVDLGLGGRGAA